MPRYLVERSFARELELSADALDGVVAVNEDEGVAWLSSFLSADKKKAYCLYEATNPEAIMAAARRNNLPVDAIIEVTQIGPGLLV